MVLCERGQRLQFTCVDLGVLVNQGARADAIEEQVVADDVKKLRRNACCQQLQESRPDGYAACADALETSR